MVKNAFKDRCVCAGEKQIYSPTEGREAFLQLARLCGDPNLVGTMLLDHIPSMPLGELACSECVFCATCSG